MRLVTLRWREISSRLKRSTDLPFPVWTLPRSSKVFYAFVFYEYDHVNVTLGKMRCGFYRHRLLPMLTYVTPLNAYQ